MKWFTDEKDPAFVEQHKSAVEIVAHKNATKEAKKLVDEANSKLQEVFKQNHFTVKLYIAAGGRKPKQTGVSK